MGLKAELEEKVTSTFSSRWSERDGQVVPDDKSVTLGNDAINLTATVLYADLADSTKMVDKKTKTYAAEVYKAFLHCAAKVIESEGGTITAYDGDRIMAVYLGDSKNTKAVRSGLKIRYAVTEIINPAKNKQYPNAILEPVKFVVGIDTSSLFVAKTGVRGANDLVWVGRAANYAAKLSALPSTYVYITEEIYENINVAAKLTNDKDMWEPVKWDTFDDRTIYRSHWQWRIE